jgi:hypothetical protein
MTKVCISTVHADENVELMSISGIEPPQLREGVGGGQLVGRGALPRVPAWQRR